MKKAFALLIPFIAVIPFITILPKNSLATECTTQPFVSASVSPSTVRPYEEVTVKCNYGKRLDCLKVTGAGLTGCRYSRYEGTDTIFVCSAGANVGYYDDVKCETITGTSANCCASSTSAGNMTVLGTDVNYDQKLILPFGTYFVSARVLTAVSQGKGVRISLVCNSETCANGTKLNGTVYSMSFPTTADYVKRKDQSVTLTGTGDDRSYLFRISVDRGSEAYIDSVSLKNASGKELIKNGDFTETVQSSVNTSQPESWAEGDNRVGYYYGSLSSSQKTKITVPTVTPVASTTPLLAGSTTVTLAIKVKLQGIATKPENDKPISVGVKLGGGNLTKTTAYKSVQFSVDAKGIWAGEVSFDAIPPGSGYKVYIKGPKHLQKKVCDASPSESSGGAYNCTDGTITLGAGTNSLDFSHIILLAGDLPEAGGKQNGITDSFDTTYIRQNLGSTDAQKLMVGDLNYDNIIDTQDYSIVLQTLSTKYDEE